MGTEDTCLLYGTITKDDIKNARAIMASDEVYEVRMRKIDRLITPDLAVVILLVSDIIVLSEDTSIKAITDPYIDSIKPLADYFHNSGRLNTYIGFDLYLEKENKLFYLLMVAKTNDYWVTAQKVEANMEEILAKASDGSCLKATLDDEGELELTDCEALRNLYEIIEECI